MAHPRCVILLCTGDVWELRVAAATLAFSKVVKVTSVAVISNRAFSGGIRARLGNRGYIRDFGKTLAASLACFPSPTCTCYNYPQWSDRVNHKQTRRTNKEIEAKYAAAKL